MVIYSMKWDIRPGMVDAYREWAHSAVKRLLAVPGVVEFRAYRMITGCHQVAVTFEFIDMQALASWQSNEDTQKALEDGREYTSNITTEILGPSPIVPEPIRPKQ